MAWWAMVQAPLVPLALRAMVNRGLQSCGDVGRAPNGHQRRPRPRDKAASRLDDLAIGTKPRSLSSPSTSGAFGRHGTGDLLPQS